MSEHLPVVDEKRLARALRLKTWPAGALATEHQRMAARVITDANQPSLKTGTVTPESALVNGTTWIDRAYKDGMKDGARAANKEWRARIMAIFRLTDSAATDRKE